MAVSLSIQYWPAKNWSSKGGALIEFLITIPILLVFLSGIVSSGRLLTNLSLTGQAAFLGGLFVSQANNTSDIDAIPLRVQRILCLQNKKFTNADCLANAAAAPMVTIIKDGGADPQAASISIRGEFSFMLVPIDIDVAVTAPILLLAPDIASLGLNLPANPQTPYSCATGSSGASCDCRRNPAVNGSYCTES